MAVLLALSFAGLSTTSASASTSDEVNILPTLDTLNRAESPLSNGGKWSALSWASGTATGRSTTTGWGPSNAFPTVNGAYWTPSTFSDKTGDAAAITMQTSPGGTERYVALWLNMPNPSSAKTGYQLSWTYVSPDTYSVALSKWSSGTQTVLASNASVSIPTGTTMAISDSGGSVAAWRSSGGSLSSLLSASDSSYASGYAGIEGAGNISRSVNFKAGLLLGGAITGASVLDDLERSEVPLATGKWSKASWANEIGGAWMGSWRGYGANSGLASAYWNQASFSDAQGGDLVAATVGTGSVPTGQYSSLLLNMPNPGSARSGYEARFTGTGSATNYTVELARWTSGTRTVLASTTGFSLSVGTTMALTDSGDGLVLWTGTSALSPLLSATDSAYASGYAGLEVNGGAGTLYNFRAGNVGQLTPPDTTISSGPSGTVVPNVSFGFSSPAAGASFECSLDSSAWQTCISPKSYQGLSEGPHVFRARAQGPGGNDETPAERSFQVLTAATLTAKTALLDNLERSEVPLANGNWAKTSWAPAIGGTWMSPYRGYGSSSGLSGAYWSPAAYNDGGGTVLVAATVGTGSVPTGQYSSLLLNMPNPGSARSGYEARFTGTGSATNYNVELAKWESGIRTVLNLATGFSLPVGTTIALTQTAGGSLALWTGTSAMPALLAANDSAYTSGYAGLEVNGGAGTLYNFRAGNIDTQAPNTTITSGPTGSVLPAAVSFAFTSTESGSTFECSLDAAAFSACSTPKAYPTITQGAHSFKVKAIDGAGNADATPAERSFTVVKPPSVTTNPATSVTGKSATLDASINPEGAATTYQFEYGTSTSYGSVVPASAKAIGSGTVAVQATEPITGLTPGTTYHFRISATNANGISKGANRTFTTPTAPLIALESPTNIDADEATLNAKVNPKGATTTYQFEYGTTTSYGTKVPASPKAIGSGTSSVAVSETPSGLAEGTAYHYRIVATNEVGTTYGADQTLDTPLLPDATTETASGVDANEAILNGAVDPNGSDTTYRFEYGPTSSYGSVVPDAIEEIETGSEEEEAEEAIAFLQPSTTYHYRIIATSEAGTVVGEDKTLTTVASSVSPQQELEEREEEKFFTARFTGPLPSDFVNLHWSGDTPKEVEPQNMEVIRNSGADMLRLGVDLGDTHDRLFERSAKRGIIILPGLGGNDLPPESEWQAKVQHFEAIVRRYGRKGTFWKESGLSESNAPAYWEIWNEENIDRNGSSQGGVNPQEFGRFIEKAANAVRNVDPSAKILLGGLLSVSKKPGEEAHVTPAAFLKQMGHQGAYDAVGLHPYAFKVKYPNGQEGAPVSPAQVEKLTEKVRGNIQEVRDTLDDGLEGTEGNNTEIWINELGWPVENPEGDPNTHPRVSPQVQSELLRSSFQMIKARSKAWKIRNVFYYNTQDWPEKTTWDYRSGLRNGAGLFRPSWYAFQDEAGVLISWPAKPVAITKGAVPKAKRATLIGTVNPHGLTTFYRFRYGTTENYGNSTSWQKGPFEEGEVDVASEISGLTPEIPYHYKFVTKNENGEEAEGLDKQFKTTPSTETTATVSTLNGEPGWASVHGWVKEGGEGPGLTNTFVNVIFEKEVAPGDYDIVDEKTRHPIVTNGQYNIDFTEVTLGKGNWLTQTFFPGQGEYEKSQSGIHKFTIKNAYQLVARHSGKCLQVEGTGNAAAVTQRACTNPQSTLKQDFTLVPQGGGYYQLVVRNSNRCLDVVNASQSQNARLQIYDCLGGGQANQIWNGVAIETLPDGNVWAKYVAKHSGQCMSVLNGSIGEGAEVVQASCTGAGNQQWTFVSVEANQVPVDASITVDEVLHGHPGYVTFHGNVTSNGYNMDNYWVNVNFQREVGPGNWQTVEGQSIAFDLPPSGHFSRAYWGVGTGKWQTRVVLMGTGPLENKASEYRGFTVLDGYKLRFRHSDRCLSTSANGTANGTQMIQWDCGPPNAYDGQTFTFRPVGTPGSNLFQIRPDTAAGTTAVNSGMCVDVAGVSQSPGAYLQLWQCLGEGQTNQIWHVVPILNQEPWFAAIATHSNQCMDVANANVNNGARFTQWSCAWTGNQQWRFIPVG